MHSDELINRLVDNAAPVQPAFNPFTLALIWMGGAALYIGIALLLFGVRSDLVQQWHHPFYSSEILLLAATIISCSLCSALLAYPDLYQKSYLLASPIIIFALLTGVLYLAWVNHPQVPAPAHGLSCTLHITLLSFLPAATLFYGMGKLACTHYAKAGLVALLTAFGIGAMIARLNEQTDSITHIVQWHYLPILGFALVGVLLGRLLLRW